MEINKSIMYVITHKDVNLELPLGYKLLYVGASKVPKESVIRKRKYYYDDDGINISFKNKNYCELTGLYWIWKNQDCDIVGISHYRRFFTKNKFSENFQPLRLEDAEKILKTKDIIVPKRRRDAIPVKEHYARRHYESDLDLIRNIVKGSYADYIEDFDDAFSKYFLFPCNMMICKKKVFDDYCTWLFDILEKLELAIDISQRDDYQKRVYGFLSERLFMVWVIHNKLKFKEFDIIETEKPINGRNNEAFIEFKVIIKGIILRCKKKLLSFRK